MVIKSIPKIRRKANSSMIYNPKEDIAVLVSTVNKCIDEIDNLQDRIIMLETILHENGIRYDGSYQI